MTMCLSVAISVTSAMTFSMAAAMTAAMSTSMAITVGIVTVAVSMTAIVLSMTRVTLCATSDGPAHRQVDVSSTLHLGNIEGVDAEQFRQWQGSWRLCQGALRNRNECVDALDGLNHLLQLFWRHGVNLIQQDLIGEGYLLCRFIDSIFFPFSCQLLNEVLGIYQRQHTIDLAIHLAKHIAIKCLADWTRVRDTCGFYDNAV
mmetsp:Transcript_55156/g.129133  ORF Transcript_55156/g.129133 Transcript_55156/m.129133 type:complete len:202 (-) Transcript_55156:711-1316(-)